MSEPKCNLCETGFPLNEHGEHLPSQRLGMIPVTRCKKLPPAPSAAEKQRGSGKPAWWKLGVPEPSRHSGQAVDRVEWKVSDRSHRRHHYDAPDGFPCSCGKPIDDPIHIPRIEL